MSPSRIPYRLGQAVARFAAPYAPGRMIILSRCSEDRPGDIHESFMNFAAGCRRMRSRRTSCSGATGWSTTCGAHAKSGRCSQGWSN